MFFSGVLIPINLRVTPFVSLAVSPSTICEIWNVWRFDLASVI